MRPHSWILVVCLSVTLLGPAAFGQDTVDPATGEPSAPGGSSVGETISAEQESNPFGHLAQKHPTEVSVLPPPQTTGIPSATLLGIDWSTSDLYAVSTTDASLVLLGNLGLSIPGGLEFGPDGLLYVLAIGGSLHRFDPDTLDGELVGPSTLAQFEGSVVIAPDGTVYGTNSGTALNPGLFTIDPDDGSTTAVGTIGPDNDINGMAWRSDGKLVGLDRVTNGLLEIDPTDAQSSVIAVIPPTVGGVGGMAVLGDTAYLATSGPSGSSPGSNELYEVDLFTGATQLVGSFDPTISGVGISGLAAPATGDADEDDVPDNADLCPDTAIPEAVPTKKLGVNRWALTDDDDPFDFDTTPPPGGGNGPGFSFTTTDTAGCSCDQIIANLGLGLGHEKFGCSNSAMFEWIAYVWNDDSDGILPGLETPGQPAGGNLIQLFPESSDGSQETTSTRLSRSTANRLRSADRSVRSREAGTIDLQLSVLKSSAVTDDTRGRVREALLGKLDQRVQPDERLRIVRGLVGQVDPSLDGLLRDHLREIRVAAIASDETAVAKEAEQLMRSMSRSSK